MGLTSNIKDQDFVSIRQAIAKLGSLKFGPTSSPVFADLTLTAPSNIYALSHDSFADFVANEHINHTAVTLTAGKGLSGGGDISTNRTFALDLTEMTGNVVWDDGSTDASITWTYALSGATDPVWTIGNNSMDLSTGALKQGGTQVMLVGDSPTAHTHDGDTLQLDGVNSDGGAFAFTTSGAVTFSQDIILNGTETYGIDLSGGTWTAGLNLETDCKIYSNGTRIGEFDSTNYNVFWGMETFENDRGQYNVGIGYQAGYYNKTGAGTRGQYNVCIGYRAGRGDSTGNEGYDNFALGAETLYSLTTGYQNVAIGYQSLNKITSGFRNTSIGKTSMVRLTTGSHNLAFGYQTCYSNQTGLHNISIGNYSGGGTTATASRSYNTSIGSYCGYNLTTGSSNVLIGYNAGYNQTTNSNLLIIDNQDRGSTALEATNSLLYGLFDAAPANQYLKVNGNLYLSLDSRKIYLGTGNDAEIYYDGTNLVIDPDAVGTGVVNVKGGLYAGDGGSTNYAAFATDGELTLNGTAKVTKTKTFVFNYRNITVQGKPTLVNQGVFYGFSLPIYNSDDEELFACRCMDNDWDGTTDPVIYVGGWLDTANDTKKFNLQVSVETADFASNDVVPVTTNDYATETTTGTWAQYTSFKVAFTIDASTIGLAVGQPLAIRIRRLDASADEIAGEVVIEGAVLSYVANKLGAAT